VLDGGRVVAVGTHRELLDGDPVYQALLSSPDDLSEVRK
jgi:ABC-type multidrug transport system fused ATPase/permease subunit